MTASVVIPAAGSGVRLGGERKQFRLLGGVPLLIQTATTFVNHPVVRQVVVACPVDSIDRVEAAFSLYLAKATVLTVAGGETRQQSVMNALQLVEGLNEDIVLIHDAVRPFVKEAQIDAVLAAASVHGAAAPAIAVTDTLRRASDGFFAETMPREEAFRMQTPQGFRLSQILSAHRSAIRDGVLATDDVELYQRYVGAVSMVPGDEDNIKITSEHDWALAQSMWASRPVHVKDS